ncbi:MAG: tRNA (cytidine(34)-2'-O)-methyltransferase [Burkholderiales bacterium]|nr:tRNA (cytidine(34)-2'-O)-methyltransferase [Burkholderiales bacterium]|tara:strand:+ start:210 stop:674 length:465 start_codon:yes stop_codon:yes gene_type:complete
MFRVILYQPEIPPNTGNIIRLCANTGCHLDLIEPLGFHWDNKALIRAGLDYHEFANIQKFKSWAYWRRDHQERRVVAFTTKGRSRYDQFDFQSEDCLLFGPESRGLPDDILDEFPKTQKLRIPMLPESRSLNLSNTVSIAIFEAWRQAGFGGLT